MIGLPLYDVHVLGLLIQAGGAGLIALFNLLMYRALRKPALRLWAVGWLALMLALLALLGDWISPATIKFNQSVYLLGEYVYLYLLVMGCTHFASGRAPRRSDLWLLIPAAAIACTLPQLTGGEFQPLFLIQTAILAAGFVIALRALSTVRASLASSPGLWMMRTALTVLALLFAHYVPLFGRAVWFGLELPLRYLELTSITHLLFEFLLGYGGALVVLESVNRTLHQCNSELSSSNERFQHLAEYDPLTGAFNRHAFSALSESLARGPSERANGSVALFDLDGLKTINDGVGHQAGDRLLQALAKTIQHQLRRGDLLFRWGGDEFLLIAMGLGSVELEQRLQSINRELRAAAELRAIDPKLIGVTFGSADFSSESAIADAINAADQQMYARRRARTVGQSDSDYEFSLTP